MNDKPKEPRKRPGPNAFYYHRWSQMYQAWSDDPRHDRLMEEDAEMRRELAKVLPPDKLPPLRKRPPVFSDHVAEEFGHMASLFRALRDDEPPEGLGILAPLLSKYLGDPSDPQTCQAFEHFYPEVYQGLLDSAERHQHCGKAPDEVAEDGDDDEAG